MMRLDLVTHCRALLLPPRPPLGANARAACAPPVLSLFSAHPQAVGHARRFGLRQAATCHSVEHPFRNFQTAGRPIRRLSTSKRPRPSPRHHIVDEHTQSKPGVPGIKYFPFFAPVGVMLLGCTTAIRLIRALTDARPIKPSSTRCLSARRPNLGRGSTYRPGNSVQTTAAT